MADQVEANRPSDAFKVYGKDAWKTLLLFLAASTQWRVVTVSGMAGGRLVYLGLDYPAVEVTARMAGIPTGPGRFEELRDMEAAAARILNEHR